MTTDRYTKAVLTVIAACLVLLVLKTYQIIPDAHAEKGVQRVHIESCSGNAFSKAEPIQIRGSVSTF